VGESVVSLTDVTEARVIKQYLLQNKCGHSFAEFRATLHNAQAQGNYFSGQQKCDDLLLVGLDQGTDHSQRGKPQIFKGPSFAHCVEEWVEEQWKVSLQESGPENTFLVSLQKVRSESRPCFWVAGHALQ